MRATLNVPAYLRRRGHEDILSNGHLSWFVLDRLVYLCEQVAAGRLWWS